MNALGSLSEIIAKHKAKFTQLLQAEVSSTLDLHLPECIIDSESLSHKQLYGELCLHAYAHKKAGITLARKILTLEYQIRGKELPEPDVIDNVLKRTYTPLARKWLGESFNNISSNHLKKDFYNHLPALADYTGVKYLADFLPLNRLPKIRKPNQNNQRRTIEFQFILNASEFTRYDENGKRMKRKRSYGQYCAWSKCCSQTEFKSVYHYQALKQRYEMFNPANGNGLYFFKNDKPISIRMVTITIKNRPETFFVCFKKCYDALRIDLQRHLTN